MKLVQCLLAEIEKLESENRIIAIDDFFDLLPNIDKATIQALEKVLYKLETNEIELIVNAFHFEKDKVLNG